MKEQELETVHVEITAKNGKKILLGSLYRAPNTDGKQMVNHIGEVIS